MEIPSESNAEVGAPVFQLNYPPELPITSRVDEIIDTIAKHSTVVIAGETGSGKSTQLPKICVAAGLDATGIIGHTQPRRIAARSVAKRIADELETDLGDYVGYSVRFDNKTGDNTAIKVMTDGILLAELSRDPLLKRYSVIIVDEAHERSLNIDFLLGSLHQIQQKRKDLKVIVTSATIDTEKISKHFDNAPVIEVSGRSYPVETIYRPLDDGDNFDTPIDVLTGVNEAITELHKYGPGDILVFSSGEREIAELCEAVSKYHRDLEVLPLYSRLSNAEQNRIFTTAKRRRVVIATNVAETSLTVPGIRYVIDIGEARISRFSQRTKVQRLPIEEISQASANQRSGRCGRLGPGVAIRLYSQENFEARPEYTEPEIRRTNLASVLLTMARRNLGDPASFPFIDPPEHRALIDGAKMLYELRATKSAHPEGRSGWLTRIGRTISDLPIDPRLARIIIEGSREGCLSETIILAAGLTIQDPRQRPRDNQSKADESHSAFHDIRGDFITMLHLWHKARRARSKLTRRQFDRWCNNHFLHRQRMREWVDLVAQLEVATKDAKFKPSYSSSYDPNLEPITDSSDVTDWCDDIHRSVLSGLLSQIGVRQETTKQYRGPRSVLFTIQPGSACFGTNFDWVVAQSLVETTKLWARNVAPIEPGWLEEPAKHLTTTTRGISTWDRERARTITTETVRLFGLTIVADRVVPLDKYDRVQARADFITNALIEGNWSGNDQKKYRFLDVNRSIREETQSLILRATQRTFDEEHSRVFDFYDSRLPSNITSGAHFSSWLDPQLATDIHLLEMSVSDLADRDEITFDADAYPDSVEYDGIELRYDYSQRSAQLEIPLEALAGLNPINLVGIAPGNRNQILVALARQLPKEIRKKLVPIPETVAELAVGLPEPDGTGNTLIAFRHAIETHIAMSLPLQSLDPRQLDIALRPNYSITKDSADGKSQILATGDDLELLQSALQKQLHQAREAGAAGISHPGAQRWDFTDLPQKVEISSPAGTTFGYPALIDKGDSVAVEILAHDKDARNKTWAGIRRLLRLTVAAPLREMNAVFNNDRIAAMVYSAHGDRKAFFEDLTLACIGSIIDEYGLVWTESDFTKLQKKTRRELPSLATDIAPRAARIIDLTADIRIALAASSQLPGDCVGDIRDHLERLVFPGHLSAVGVDRIDDVVRYLQAISHRLSRLAARIGPDREAMQQIWQVERRYDTIAAHVVWSPELESITWALEELRVNQFAQHLRTKQKVSVRRISKRLEALISQ